MSWLPAPMTLPAPTRRGAAQDDVRLEGDVGAEVDGPVEVDRGRVAHRDPVAHVRLVEPDAQAPLGGGQLGPVVDAVEPAVVLEGDRADEPAVLAGERDEVGQVQLAGRRRRRERLDPAPQPRGIEGVEPGVDLVAGQFLGRRVLRLDDPLDRPELAADDPAELGRVGGEDAGQRDRGVVLAARLEDRVEVGAGHERHVARQDEDLGRVGGDDREGGADGVAGPARLVLERERRRDRRRRRRWPRPAASRRRPGGRRAAPSAVLSQASRT